MTNNCFERITYNHILLNVMHHENVWMFWNFQPFRLATFSIHWNFVWMKRNWFWSKCNGERFVRTVARIQIRLYVAQQFTKHFTIFTCHMQCTLYSMRVFVWAVAVTNYNLLVYNGTALHWIIFYIYFVPYSLTIYFLPMFGFLCQISHWISAIVMLMFFCIISLSVPIPIWIWIGFSRFRNLF